MYLGTYKIVPSQATSPRGYWIVTITLAECDELPAVPVRVTIAVVLVVWRRKHEDAPSAIRMTARVPAISPPVTGLENTMDKMIRPKSFILGGYFVSNRHKP